MGDEHAAGRGRGDVDRRDVDGTAQEGDEIGRAGEQRRLTRRGAVGNDDGAAPRGLDKLRRRQVAPGRIAPHGRAERLQRAQGAAVVGLQILGIVG